MYFPEIAINISLRIIGYYIVKTRALIRWVMARFQFKDHSAMMLKQIAWKWMENRKLQSAPNDVVLYSTRIITKVLKSYELVCNYLL